MNTVSIIGSGNVGRRIGEYFSKKTHVIFNDIDKKIVEELNIRGYDATTDIDHVIKTSDISFIALPTPLTNDGLYNTTFLNNVSISVGKILKTKYNYHIFVLKSTVVPGTTEDIIIPTIEKYSEKKEGKDFGVIYNPEFLTVISNTWTKDGKFCIAPKDEERIVIGEGKNRRAGDIIEEFYKDINPEVPILRTDYKTAEMTKLVANERLALAISFSNEIFLVCEEMKKNGINIDADFIIKSMSMDKRIGKYGSIFGKAWGGPCFIKDTVALETFIKNKTGKSPDLISGSIRINNEMAKKYGIRE